MQHSDGAELGCLGWDGEWTLGEGASRDIVMHLFAHPMLAPET
jgi:hypothetical protein